MDGEDIGLDFDCDPSLPPRWFRQGTSGEGEVGGGGGTNDPKILAVALYERRSNECN